MASNLKDCSDEEANVTMKQNPSKVVESDNVTKVPIFTQQFLEHNKEREQEMRQLRKAAGDIEEENKLLANHIASMKLATEELKKETAHQQQNNDSLQEHLHSLRQLIVVEFSGENVLGVDEDLTVENADEFVAKLNSLISGTPGRGQEKILGAVTDIVGRMDLSTLASRADGDFPATKGLAGKSEGRVTPSSSHDKKKKSLSRSKRYTGLRSVAKLGEVTHNSPDIQVHTAADIQEDHNAPDIEVHNAVDIEQSHPSISLETQKQEIKRSSRSKNYSCVAKMNIAKENQRSVHSEKEGAQILDIHIQNRCTVESENHGGDNGIICLDDAKDDSKNASKNLTRRRKSKEKVFQCSECNKGFCDQKRLDAHFENIHTFESDDDWIICLYDVGETSNNNTTKDRTVKGRRMTEIFDRPKSSKGNGKRKSSDDRFQSGHKTKSDDSFGDVGPGTDIAVRCGGSKMGFEVCKVIKVYTTGRRFQCVKYSPINNNRWALTQSNKNVMKVDIVKILKTVKKERAGKNVYTIDKEELAP